MKKNPVKTAVVTGGHSYDVTAFHHLFRGLDGADAYIQHMDDFASSSEDVRDSYDTVLFYIMLKEGPADEGLEWYEGKQKTALERLGKTEQGIFILHHALLTKSLSAWDMIDETYTMKNPSEGSRILLSVDHEKSMKHIAWTRIYRKSRVFCFQSGHDNTTWKNPNFKQVLQNGITWCAGL